MLLYALHMPTPHPYYDCLTRNPAPPARVSTPAATPPPPLPRRLSAASSPVADGPHQPPCAALPRALARVVARVRSDAASSPLPSARSTDTNSVKAPATHKKPTHIDTIRTQCCGALPGFWGHTAGKHQTFVHACQEPQVVGFFKKHAAQP